MPTAEVVGFGSWDGNARFLGGRLVVGKIWGRGDFDSKQGCR